MTNVALSSVQTSNAITVAGINTGAAISVTGGTYSIGCTGTFTAGAGTIASGQSVCVRHTASANPATATNTVLTIGGVSDTFTSTTVAADTTPDAFAFVDVTDVALGSVQTSNTITVAGINTAAAISVTGGTYSIGCTATFTGTASTITSGQTVCVRHTASASPATATNTVLTIGGVSDTFTSTTVAADTVPDAFTFTDVTNVALSSVRTSNAITVAGINTAAPISVAGGTYSIGCTASFTAAAGTINNGQTVCVQHTASASFATATNTTLTIGGVSDTFTSTTVAVDTTPDAFVFVDVTDVALGSVQTSNTITVAGINSPAAISVTGGSYSIGCTGTFTAGAGTIANAQTVCVRHTASATPATATNTVLTIGGVADTFTSTTVPADTAPDAFTFTDVTDVALGSVQTSNAIGVVGVNTAAPISVTGGTYSIGCTATFTAAPGTINNGQAVCVRHTASATAATATNTVLTIGGVSDTFTSTTIGADTTPDAFVFTDVTDVALGSVQTSNAITVAGINSPAAISVTGGTYSVGCTASFTAVAGTINNGQTVCVRHTASASVSTATNTTLTIGGVADTFTSTTAGADTTPTAFSFNDVTNVDPGSVQTSNAITVAGINTAAAISITGGTYSVGCNATFTSGAGTVTNGQMVCVRHTAAQALSATTSTVLTIGGVSDTFSSTTIASLPPTGDYDNDGIPNAIETTESRNPFLKDNDVFANPRLFAMQQYRDFLGREGEAAGIQFYVDLLNNGTADRFAIIESFLLSPEFQNGLPSVTRLYFSFFNRIPDYGGLTFQLDAFRTGTTLDVIAQNFYNSPEFTSRYGALNNDQYINLVYQNVLGRAPDPGGYTFYKNHLDNGTLTKGQMMIGFSESPEFQNLTGNESFVVGVYVGLLKRTPEPAGLDFYVDLLDGGTARSAIVPGFFNSPEYRSRFLP